MKLVKEHINEKFSEQSDAVHDMGIGVENLVTEIKKKIKKEGFSNPSDYQVFRHCFKQEKDLKKAMLIMNYLINKGGFELDKMAAEEAWNVWEYNMRSNPEESKELLDFVVQKSIDTKAKKALDIFLLNYSKNNKTDMIINLLKAGANPLMRGSKPIQLAIKFKNKKVFDLMQPYIKWK